MRKSGKRFKKSGLQKGLIKSFCFKTWSNKSFTELYNLFYVDTISDNQIITARNGPINPRLVPAAGSC